MIKEAHDTLLHLKSILDRINSGSINAQDGWVTIRNFVSVNGIQSNDNIESARIAFLKASGEFTCEGRVIKFSTMPNERKDQLFEASMAKLYDYRSALRLAKLRSDAEFLRSADGTQVSDPF